LSPLSRALWYVAPDRAEIREAALGPLAKEAVRVRAVQGALSRGTEALVAAGRVPVSEFQRMRAPFMAGDFPFPVKYGYATVGTIEQGPPGSVGRTVFALHPHQTRFDLPAEAALPVPDGVPPSRAVLAANMETALNAAWDAGEGPFGRVCVVGAGVVGALTGYLLQRLAGAEVVLVDIDKRRARLATALGLGFALPADAPREGALVVHASASAAGLATALSLAGEEATVLELSWFGAGDVPVPLGGAFHSRRLRLIASQVGKVAPSHRRDWTHRRRLAHALQLLDDDRLDALLEPAVAFASLPSELPRILAPGSGLLCQRIDYEGE
jgi:NADPH:quinone reductase-like Zn-dependent oxidoreductase